MDAHAQLQQRLWTQTRRRFLGSLCTFDGLSEASAAAWGSESPPGVSIQVPNDTGSLAPSPLQLQLGGCSAQAHFNVQTGSTH